MRLAAWEREPTHIQREARAHFFGEKELKAKCESEDLQQLRHKLTLRVCERQCGHVCKALQTITRPVKQAHGLRAYPSVLLPPIDWEGNCSPLPPHSPPQQLNTVAHADFKVTESKKLINKRQIELRRHGGKIKWHKRKETWEKGKGKNNMDSNNSRI